MNLNYNILYIQLKTLSIVKVHAYFLHAHLLWHVKDSTIAFDGGSQRQANACVGDTKNNCSKMTF